MGPRHQRPGGVADRGGRGPMRRAHPVLTKEAGRPGPHSGAARQHHEENVVSEIGAALLAAEFLLTGLRCLPCSVSLRAEGSFPGAHG